MSNITTIGVIGLGNAGAPILNNLNKFKNLFIRMLKRSNNYFLL
jgi:3-hydroxyisobutyrate dehydrogenase-like beta-hydroxyacid dehydrogenase